MWLSGVLRRLFPTGSIQRSPKLTSRPQQDGLLLEAPEENPLPCSFQLLEASCTPWPTAFFSNFKASKGWSGLSQTVSVGLFASVVTSQTLVLPPLSCSNPCDGSELTWLTQDHLPSSRLLIQSHLQSPFCHRKVTYAQVLGITIGTSLGWGIIILPTTRRRGHGYVHSCCKHILSASCMPSCSRSQRHRGTRQTITPASRSPNSSEMGRQEHDQ